MNRKVKKTEPLVEVAQEKPKYSEQLADINKLFDQALADYKYYTEEVHRCEKLTQDYLHKLELENLDWSGRAKIATQLARCRKERRQYKDIVQLLQPTIDLLTDKTTQQTLNKLREVLGQTRKQEKHMENRVYYLRALESDTMVIQRKD